jgi:hypothetical protein
MPPCFQTSDLGSNLNRRTGMLSGVRRDSVVRAAPFNASKRGMSRREFSFVHPATAHDLAQFISSREIELNSYYSQSPFSLSRPIHSPEADRAVEICSHSELESERLTRLSRYRFIARTDVSRFYHSIYTHSIPWAMHGKSIAKADRRHNSSSVFCNRLDQILRSGQDGQTIGIPVGPDASRYIAEIIGTAIDQEFINRGGQECCDVIRHVDDVWIGADTHADAETALWRYREAIRSFELDINDAKTAIFSNNFTFSDIWPSDIASKFEFAIASNERRIPERLRTALEYAFSLTTQNNDDGVLKYTLRFIDRNNLASEHWGVVEPFLKRTAVHFGHTIDYVARIIVWRHLAYCDLDILEWTPLIIATLDRHGRLGNDAEVSWMLYAAIRLSITIPDRTATAIIENCGPLSVVALLSCVDVGLVGSGCFGIARQIIANETATGTYWPLILEWRSRQWEHYDSIEIGDELIQDLASRQITLFDVNRLPAVFQNVNESDFSNVAFAIEERSSQYDDEGEEEPDDEEPF